VVCRHWQARQISIAQIRELNDIMRFERAGEAIFLSSGQYTHEAWQYAQGKPLRLIDGDGLLSLLAGVWDLPRTEAGHMQARIEPRIHAARHDS
jgi:restriction system protein